MPRYIRNTFALYSQINVTNANNSGGLMIIEKGMLFRHTKGDKAVFVILDVRKELQPLAGHRWYVDIFINNKNESWRKRRLDNSILAGEIELVK